MKLPEYKNWLEKRNLTTETIRLRLRGMRKYGEQELNTDNIVNFLKENLKKYQPHSLKSILGSLTSYARFQKINNIVWEIITRLIPKVQSKFFDTINEEELEQLKNTSWRNQKINQRNNLILDFLFYTGIRVNELINLRHCDYQGRSLKIKGKGNKVRHIPITDFLAKYFDGSNNYLFQTKNGKRLVHSQIRKIIKRGTKRLGTNKHITPHTFRRSFATLLNSREARLTSIQKILGHSDINTTSLYIHNSYEEIFKDYSKLWTFQK